MVHVVFFLFRRPQFNVVSYCPATVRDSRLTIACLSLPQQLLVLLLLSEARSLIWSTSFLPYCTQESSRTVVLLRNTGHVLARGEEEGFGSTFINYNAPPGIMEDNAAVRCILNGHDKLCESSFHISLSSPRMIIPPLITSLVDTFGFLRQ